MSPEPGCLIWGPLAKRGSQNKISSITLAIFPVSIQQMNLTMPLVNLAEVCAEQEGYSSEPQAFLLETVALGSAHRALG